MNNKALFTPCKIGSHDLSHRVVLAPMTRIRADAKTLAPTSRTIEYYRQRASDGGLLITEAIHISPEATPVWSIYPAVRESASHVPGIWTQTQMAEWRKVVKAVHEEGGKISCQLLHTGRVAQPAIAEHPLVKDKDYPLPPVSSSAVAIEALDEKDNQYNWDQASTPPRELETDEIERIIEDYKKAAKQALAAGFDYIELHAAHGYLIDQFICDGVNQRTDRYGGSIENRCRLLFEIVEALVAVMGENRVGVRLSPIVNDPKTGKPKQTYFGVTCSHPTATFRYAISGLNAFPLAYLMLTEPRVGGLSLDPKSETAYSHPLSNQKYRELFDGVLIGAGGFTPKSAAAAVEDDVYDMIAFGRWFLANPDLPERIRNGNPLNVYQRETFYGGGDAGYTDYPSWDELVNSFSRKYGLMEQDEIGVTLTKEGSAVS